MKIVLFYYHKANKGMKPLAFIPGDVCVGRYVCFGGGKNNEEDKTLGTVTGNGDGCFCICSMQ